MTATSTYSPSHVGPASLVAGQSQVPLRAAELLTYTQARACCGGISENSLRKLMNSLGVVPVQLSPRCVRIVRSELVAALAKLPRRTATEPPQLAAGKARARSGADSAAA